MTIQWLNDVVDVVMVVYWAVEGVDLGWVV
jgi:hypothetical protein